MSYMALVPMEVLFPKEHMTFLWAQPKHVRLSEDYLHHLSDQMTLHLCPIIAQVTGHTVFNGKTVALLDVPDHLSEERARLAQSILTIKPRPWRPHVTQKAERRELDRRIIFSHFEWRPSEPGK